ncbi:MAG: protein translocase subunit SecF [Proteobacteria bacterium]|nr:protein translocase subunit SecF [Pseudomonadota bacterium]
MLEIIKPNTNFDFVGKIKMFLALSGLLIVISIFSVMVKGWQFGIDFSGGTLVQVKFKSPVEISSIKANLKNVTTSETTVQGFGEENEYMIRLAGIVTDLESLSDKIQSSLEQGFGKGSFEIRRVEMVGPRVGKDLRDKATLAIIFSLIGMLIYIWWRFELRFGVGAIIALAHDVTITVGALSITNKPIDLTIIAALLTIVGYSVNDTIIALFFLGGGVIHDFAFALIIGVIVGTYSSVYIATPLVIFWEQVFPSKQRRR